MFDREPLFLNPPEFDQILFRNLLPETSAPVFATKSHMWFQNLPGTIPSFHILWHMQAHIEHMHHLLRITFNWWHRHIPASISSIHCTWRILRTCLRVHLQLLLLTILINLSKIEMCLQDRAGGLAIHFCHPTTISELIQPQRCCCVPLIPIKTFSFLCFTLAPVYLCEPPSPLYAPTTASVIIPKKQRYYFHFLRRQVTSSTLPTTNTSSPRRCVFTHASLPSAQEPSCVHLPSWSGACDVLVALLLVELRSHGQDLLQCQPRSINVMLQLDDLPLPPPLSSTHFPCPCCLPRKICSSARATCFLVELHQRTGHSNLHSMLSTSKLHQELRKPHFQIPTGFHHAQTTWHALLLRILLASMLCVFQHFRPWV